jgi:HK97 family phage major capsid protein
MAKIEEMRARVAALIGEVEAINNAGGDENDLNDDELETIEAKSQEIERLTRQINAAVRVADASALQAGTGRRTAAEPRAREREGEMVNYRQPKVNDPKWGFKSLGEFGITVRHAAVGRAEATERLLNATTTFGGENVGADGGFAVPPEFKTGIVQKINTPDSLLTLTDRLTTSSNSITIPKDETTPWQSTGGIQAYWENEGAQIPPSKPLLEQNTIRLNKLTCLVPVSDELLEDGPGLDSYLRAKAPAKMISKLNTAIIDGSGAGQPKGILQSLAVNGGSVVGVAGETGTNVNTGTILYPNIVKMWAALYGQWRRNAVWLINQDAEAALAYMDFRRAGSSVSPPTSPVPVYLPDNNVSGPGFATLKGRPVIPVEACKALGTEGDIILVDLNQYLTCTKGQDIKTDVSIHLYFDQDVTAFRFIMRVAGQPWWTSPIAPQQPTASLRSWAVTLQARP